MTTNSRVSQTFIAMRTQLARAISSIVPPKDIEDIVQETYVRACNFERKSKINHPPSFLLKTVKNLALDHIKSAGYRLSDSVDDIDEFHSGRSGPDEGFADDEVLNNALAHEEFSYFCEAVRLLPIQCRRAFILKKVYGYSQREIAHSLKISESTVEKHIADGVKRCTYFMMHHYDTSKGSTSPIKRDVKDFGGGK